jgi:hypothetical protein
MQITKEFLVVEIQSLEQELNKAQVFQIQAQATIAAYKMLLNRLEAPEEQEKQDDNAI